MNRWYKCERCSNQLSPDEKKIYDFCADCGKSLCPDCMNKGCCENIPANSGDKADEEMEQERIDKMFKDKKPVQDSTTDDESNILALNSGQEKAFCDKCDRETPCYLSPHNRNPDNPTCDKVCSVCENVVGGSN